MALGTNNLGLHTPRLQGAVVDAEFLGSAAIGSSDTMVVGLGCLLIVSGLWAFGIHNGFDHETYLIYLSDLKPGFEGFFYPDPLRKFTSLFYHLSYVLGSAFGVRGSFVPYQLVYAALWVLRALLTYLIVLRLMPGRPALAIFAGLFAALHAADGALNWVGQLNQFGFIFLMLLSFLLLLIAFDTRRLLIAGLAALGSAAAAYLSLWSYESPLPVMLTFPAVVAVLRRDIRPSRLAWVNIIYLVPVVAFLGENIVRYLSIGGGGATTYQMAVSRHDYSLPALVKDLELHLKNSIAFWNWPNSLYLPENLWNYGGAGIPVLIGAGLLLIRAVIVESRSTQPFCLDGKVFRFACAAFGLVVASYLVILVLNDNRHLWRTEFLPSWAAASLMAVALYSLLRFVPGSALRLVASAPLVIAVGIYATLGGVNSALNNGAGWERQRAIIASIVSNAPYVADGTLFVIRNGSHNADPFGYNEYLDLALHLAYPGRKVAGTYFFADSGPAPGPSNVDLNGGEPRIRPEVPLLTIPPTSIEHVLVFDYDPSTRQVNPVAAGPMRVGAVQILAKRSEFCAAVAGFMPVAATVQRYGPITAAHTVVCSKEGAGG
jgi:hypothetical protein